MKDCTRAELNFGNLECQTIDANFEGEPLVPMDVFLSVAKTRLAYWFFKNYCFFVDRSLRAQGALYAIVCVTYSQNIFVLFVNVWT